MGQGQWGHHTLRSISDPVCPSLFVFVANERCYSLIFSALKRCTATGRRVQEIFFMNLWVIIFAQF